MLCFQNKIALLKKENIYCHKNIQSFKTSIQAQLTYFFIFLCLITFILNVISINCFSKLDDDIFFLQEPSLFTNNVTLSLCLCHSDGGYYLKALKIRENPFTLI